MPHDAVRPDEHADPVAAVRAAHRRGAPLSLATSGTTAIARRIRRTTDSWWGSFEAYAALTGVERTARLWLPGPMASTMVLFAAVHAAEVGAHLVTGPCAATHACLTPAQLWQHAGRLPSGTVVTTAGAGLPDTIAQAARDAGLEVRTYYGAAELSFVAADRDGRGLRAFDEVELTVKDGVIWVRSPWLSEGYDSDAMAGGALRREEDGWATVGDLGRLDGATLIVTGRPETITTAGATVLVADIEALLAPAASAPFAVHEAAHPILGAVVAVTVTAPTDGERLLTYARAHLPAAHRPRVVQQTDRLPLTPAGKLDRTALTRAAS